MAQNFILSEHFLQRNRSDRVALLVASFVALLNESANGKDDQQVVYGLQHCICNKTTLHHKEKRLVMYDNHMAS